SLFATTYSGEVIIIDNDGKQVLENQRDKGSALKCSVLMHNDIEPRKLEGHQIVSGGENQVLTLYKVESSAMIPKVSRIRKCLRIIAYGGCIFQTVFRGHERSVECVDVNKECSRLVSGGFDSMIKVWNLECDQATVFEKGTDSDQNPKKRKENFVTKVRFISSGHKDAVVGLRWCSWNSSQVISASWDHCIALWDLQL
ncbi:hypothetical protein Angca_007113, partial [Angiostrongylus cantonensis]